MLALTVEGKAPALNDLLRAKGAGHHAYNALKKRWTGRFAAAALAAAQQLPVRPDPDGFVSIGLCVFETDRRRDPDNVAAAARKFAQDGLVQAGVIRGDGWKHTSSLLITKVTVGDVPRTEVTVYWVERRMEQ